MTDVTTKMTKEFGFIDCWVRAGSPKPIKTCRFDTRIDYIYATPALFRKTDLVDFQIVDDRASDHNMVLATFRLKS